MGVDNVVFCLNCEEDIHCISGGILKARTSILQTLHHRIIPICISDFLGAWCELNVPYAGLSNGTSCMNKKNSFTRELLDMWLWDICRSGCNFRDTYASWSSKSCAIIALYHRIETDNFAQRQLSKDKFTMFLKTLWFPDDNECLNFFRVLTAKMKMKRATDIFMESQWMEPLLGYRAPFQNLSEILCRYPRFHVFLTKNMLFPSPNRRRSSTQFWFQESLQMNQDISQWLSKHHYEGNE